MLKSIIQIIPIIVLLLAGVVELFAQTVPPKEDEAKLIAVLKSGDASHKQKVDACRGLALIATKKAIAPLAALLGDEKLSHMARYGLEPIPDPEVDNAFRNALGKLKGKPLVGVIGSIGVRRDSQAVPALTKLLKDSNPEVAQASARALGSIGTLDAAGAIRNVLQDTSEANKLAFCEGLFRCAEALAKKGQRSEAIEIFDRLRGMQAPRQVRSGAVRGAILTREEGDVALLKQYLQSEDYFLFSAAVQTAQELPGTEITLTLAAELDNLPASHQILVIRRLGKRGDPAALPALSNLATKGEKNVRLEAIRAFPQIGHPTAVPVLVELLADADSDVSKASQEALAAIPGPKADAAIMAMLNSNQTDQRLTALELIGRRRMTASVPALLKAAGDDDTKVRPAAIRKVGELGGANEIPALLDLLMQLEAPQDLDAVERALTAVCTKTVNPRSHSQKLMGRLEQATPAQKAALFRILSITGGPDALKAVRAAVNDNNTVIRDAAIRALCTWKTTEAAPDLLALAQKAPNLLHKTAALRGYINMIRDQRLSTEKKLAMCKEASELIVRDEERKLLLGALSTVPAVEALSRAVKHLDNPAIKTEASFAVVEISEKIVQQKPAEVVDALQRVMKATDNRDVRRRARATLNKARKAAGR